jgi:hypothetical protein
MGGQTKGSEMAVVFTTMDGSLGEKKIRSREKKKMKVPDMNQFKDPQYKPHGYPSNFIFKGKDIHIMECGFFPH